MLFNRIFNDDVGILPVFLREYWNSMLVIYKFVRRIEKKKIKGENSRKLQITKDSKIREKNLSGLFINISFSCLLLKIISKNRELKN